MQDPAPGINSLPGRNARRGRNSLPLLIAGNRQMFEIGGLEILVIGLVALIVFGPEKLPDTAIKAARMFNSLKRGWVELQRRIFTEAAFREEAEKKAKKTSENGERGDE